MDTPAPASRTALWLAFATIYLVWGSAYLAVRGAGATLPPGLMAGAGVLTAGSILYAWLWFTRRIRPTPRQWFDNAIVGALLLLGGNGLVSWAEQTVPSGIATLLISVGPLFIVLGDWLVLVVGRDHTRGARPTLPTLAGIALGVVGLVLLVAPSLSVDAAVPLDPWRVGGILIACVTWSAGSIYTRYARTPAEPMTAAAIQMLTGGLWLVLAAAALGEPGRFDPAGIAPHSVLAWLYLVFVGSLVGFTTFVWLMKHSTPARVSTYAYVNPVVAVFLGWLLASEPLTARTVGATAVIILAVVMINGYRGKGRKGVPRLRTAEIAEIAEIEAVEATT